MNKKISELTAKGVIVTNPESVTLDDSVDTSRICKDVTIHAGCRISGKTTYIGASSVIGEEAPVTIQDCQIGENVALKGGFFSGSTFLDGVEFCSGGHVRPGTLIEECVT